MTAVRYASEHGIPVHARGAGSDSGGGALGPGLVVDLSRHLRQVVAIEPEHVVVEAGVVPERVNRLLANVGRRLEPIPRDPDVTTIGGMIAVDAAGGRSLRYGSTGSQVERLRVVLAGGERVDLGYEPWPDPEPIEEPGDTIERVVRKLQNLYRRGPDGCTDCGLRHRGIGPDTRSTAPRMRRACTSPGWWPALRGRWRSSRRPSCGPCRSQGPRRSSCCRSTGPRRRRRSSPSCSTRRRPPARATCSTADRSGWPATSIASSARRSATRPSRCWSSSSRIPTRSGPPSGSAKAIEKAGRTGWAAGMPATFTRRPDCDRLLGWRRPVEGRLMRLRGPSRPVSIFDDVGVPPDRLAAVLERLQKLFQAADVTWTMDACAGEGRLRLRPFLDMASPADRDRLEPLTTSVYDIVLEAGGTVSSSQASGLARTQFHRRQFGELIQVFREIKDAFDPMGLLNPGKVIGDDPHLMVRDLRAALPAPEASSDDRAGLDSSLDGSGTVASPTAAVETSSGTIPLESRVVAVPAFQPTLIWPELSMLETAEACHGCGLCRTSEPPLRMCPSFRATGMEAASPRAQANLLRQVAAGVVDPRLWGSEELRPHADLCIHCKLCRPECPSGVDVSALMVEAKAAYVETHGLAPRRLDLLTAGTLGAAGEPAADRDQFPPHPPMGPRMARAAARTLATSRAAPRPPDAVRAEGRPDGAAPAAAAAAGAAGRLLRRPLRQLLRPGTGRGDRGGAPARRGECVRAVAAAELGDGLADRRRHRPRPRARVHEPPHPRQRGPRWVHGRLLGADRGADAPRGIRPADRRPRRRARRRAHDGAGAVPDGSARPRAAPDAGRAAPRRGSGITSPAICGPRRRHARARPAPRHPRAGRRVHRSRLLGDGRDLWAGCAIGSATRSGPGAG